MHQPGCHRLQQYRSEVEPGLMYMRVRGLRGRPGAGRIGCIKVIERYLAIEL